MNIESLSEFIEWASQFNDGQYLFRGVPDDSYEIEASACRRLPEGERDNPARLLKVNQELIKDARGRGHDQKNGQQLHPIWNSLQSFSTLARALADVQTIFHVTP